MTSESLIDQIEHLTSEMVEQARLEQWNSLADNELKRRQLLEKLPSFPGATEAALPRLKHIAELNQDLIRRTTSRRDDIGLLLQAFGGTLPSEQ